MKFRQTIEIEIPDNDLLGYINENLEWDDKPPIKTLKNLAAANFIEILGDRFWNDEFHYASEYKTMTIIE